VEGLRAKHAAKMQEVARAYEKMETELSLSESKRAELEKDKLASEAARVHSSHAAANSAAPAAVAPVELTELAAKTAKLLSHAAAELKSLSPL